MSLNQRSWKEQEERRQKRAESANFKAALAALAGTPSLGPAKQPPAGQIARMSSRRLVIERNYQKLRPLFLAAVRTCEAGIQPGCLSAADQVQHVVRRSQARHLIDDPRNFAAICGPCHHLITFDGEWLAWAREHGLVLRPHEAAPLLAGMSPDAHGPDGEWTERLVLSFQ